MRFLTRNTVKFRLNACNLTVGYLDILNSKLVMFSFTPNHGISNRSACISVHTLQISCIGGISRIGKYSLFRVTIFKYNFIRCLGYLVVYGLSTVPVVVRSIFDITPSAVYSNFPVGYLTTTSIRFDLVTGSACGSESRLTVLPRSYNRNVRFGISGIGRAYYTVCKTGEMIYRTGHCISYFRINL